MPLAPYDEFAAEGDRQAYAKYRSWLPVLGALLGVCGAIAGYFTSPDSQGPGIFVGAIAGAAAGFVVYRGILYFSSQSTADKLYTAAWCGEHRLNDLGDDVSPANGPYAKSGVRRKAYDAIEGDLNGMHTLFYNFSYWTRQSNGKTTTEVEHPYKIMRLTGRTLPIARLTIHERSFINKFEVFDKLQGAVTPERPVKLESVAFNDRFDLTIDDNADDIWIRRVFDPATIQGLVDGSLAFPDIRYYDDAFWVIEPNHCRAEDLDSLLPRQAKAASAAEHLARVPNL